MKYASKGVAGTGLGLGIAGTALGLLNNGGLGNILGGGNCNNHCHEPMESKESAMLREQVATLRSEKYTDGAVLDLYKFQSAEFKERDRLIVANEVRSAVNEEKFNCLTKQVNRIGGIVEEHSREICDSKAREAVMGERLTALAQSTTQRFEAQGKEFWGAIGLEAERRACADENILSYVNGHYVQGKLNINPADICPSVVTCPDVLTYFNNGGKAPVPQPQAQAQVKQSKCGSC